MTKMDAQEKRWRAENDAETMARYQEIMGDKSRRVAAQKVAKEKASNLEKSLSNMRKVAGGSSVKSRKK